MNNLIFAHNNNPVRPFSGSENENANEWIQELTELQSILSLSDKEMLLCARRALQGVAKYIVDSADPPVNSLEALKDTLKHFCPDDDSQQKKKLENRKQSINESLSQYMTDMLLLASKCHCIPQPDLIQTFIKNSNATYKPTLISLHSTIGFKTIVDIQKKVKELDAYETTDIPISVTSILESAETRPIKFCTHCKMTNHHTADCGHLLKKKQQTNTTIQVQNTDQKNSADNNKNQAVQLAIQEANITDKQTDSCGDTTIQINILQTRQWTIFYYRGSTKLSSKYNFWSAPSRSITIQK